MARKRRVACAAVAAAAIAVGCLAVAAVTLAAESNPCPCKDPSLCKPIQGQRPEIFGFSAGHWKSFNFSLATTIAWSDDPELICHAHAHGVRVVLKAKFNSTILTDPDARRAWVAQHVAHAKETFVDGTNFDHEGPIALDSPLRDGYTALVQETAEAFHAAIPGSQVSLDAAWGPYGVDGRFYDWKALAEAVDIFFVMSYDTRSQIYDACLASANSPLSVAQLGVQQYLDLGVPANKTVLGLPWYGFDYPCLDGGNASARFCEIEKVPFRGAPCSDAAGGERSYGAIWQLAHNSTQLTTPVMFDELLMSKYFNFRHSDGTLHQMWFDDPSTLRPKFALAKSMDLRGVGVWNYDLLDYTNPHPQVRAATRDMWAAFEAFLN